MEICVVSDDSRVLSAIRDIAGPTVTRITADLIPESADLCVWDCDSCGIAPRSIPTTQESCNLLIVVDHSQLSLIDPDLAKSACILVKPLNPSTLRAVVNLASRAAAWREAQQRVQEIGSDRDALVDYVLGAAFRIQENEQHRTNFLAKALHDLRAPLAAMSGYCGLLADGQIGPVNAEQRDLLNSMQIRSKRLSRQAAGMFELSILGSIRRKPQFVNGDIEATIAEALMEMQSALDEKNIQPTLQVESVDRVFLFEPDQIIQVLVGLIENSCRFTPQGGSVTVRGRAFWWDGESVPLSEIEFGRREPNAYRIDIDDDGPPIQSHLLPTLFEEYASYSGSSGRDQSGGGLGLTIAKMIVSSHNGILWATSFEKGARFSFILPFEPITYKNV